MKDFALKTVLFLAVLAMCECSLTAKAAGLDLSLPKAPRVDVDGQRDIPKPVVNSHELLPLGPEIEHGRIANTAKRVRGPAINVGHGRK